MFVNDLLTETSVKKKRTRLVSYRARYVNLEEPYIGVTTDAMKRALRGTSWKKSKLCEWNFERLQEAYDKVAMEDIGCVSIVLELFLRKSTDFLRRIIASVSGMGGVTLSHVFPHCSCFPLDNYIWWCRLDTGTATTERRSTVVGGVQHAAATKHGERPTGCW